MNWYVYCSGNPIVFVDPLGLFDYNDRLSASNKYNQDVEVLQNELAYHGYYSGKIDGYFGQQTLNAVNAYKKAMGLGNTGKDWGVVGLQTWNSLGLTYLTKDDVAGGVTIKTIGLKQYKDVAQPLDDALNEIVKIAESKWRFDYAWFISQVYHNKPWDIKRPAVWNETIAKNTFPGATTKVYYNGRLMTPQELGNYTYGYIGTAMGLNEYELCTGSWVAAGVPMFNDKWNHEYSEDWPWILRGYMDYKLK